MHDAIRRTLPIVMRSVRQPKGGLTAILAVAATETEAEGAILVSIFPNGECRTLATAGARAWELQSIDPKRWVTDKFRKSGAMLPERADEFDPWSAGEHVEWRSTPGTDAVLTLLVFGDNLDPTPLEGLSGVVFVMGELVMARAGALSLQNRLEVERQERALIAAALRHDLRTPLSSILGFARVLSESRDLGSEEHLEMLELIVSEAEHMAELVADGLRREGSGPDAPLKLQPVNPAVLALSVATASLEANRIDVVLDVAKASIITDPARLTRALLNLVDNASKYSKEGEPVRVSGGLDGDHYLFTIADSGPGVSDEMVPTLFQPYSTDPDRVDGTGLGLYSVATIARELAAGWLTLAEGVGQPSPCGSRCIPSVRAWMTR